MYYNMRDFSFIRFEKSNTKNKKYDAIIEHKRTKKKFILPFGDIRYQHFHDNALGIYKHLDHGDINRRHLYKLRHAKFIKENFYSPGYFSMKYLW